MPFRHALPRARRGGVLAAAALFLGAACLVSAAGAATGEIVDRSTLRVCADPGNPPYSNDKGEGFENRIAELIAEDLGVPVEYTWFPQTVGFVRMTLAARRCDLIIGVATTNELMQNTNPYYHSTYVMVHRADLKLDGNSLSDPLLKDLRIGVQPRTPVASMLATHGLLTRMKSYPLIVDTRLVKPARDMVADVASGEIDVALAWGPLAGYWAREIDPSLVVKPLTADPGGPRLAYRISMGIRYNEPDWKHLLNDVLARRQDDINAILAGYGVPLLDTRGNPLVIEAKAALTTTPAPDPATTPAATAPAPNIAQGVAEPEGYRMENFRAPVPAGLSGARTVDAAELKAMLETGKPVLVDVFPAPRKPLKLAATTIWNEPVRETIANAHWLANMGFGALHADEAEAFRAELTRLSVNGTRPLVFFCEPECWMSWNAARRALEFGFREVVWFPGGVAAWVEEGGAVETVLPWRPPAGN